MKQESLILIDNYCCMGQSKITLQNYLQLLSKELDKKIPYDGDMADFGNEVGYAVGTIIQNMNEEQISDFITGLKHGISLTNGTH